MTTPSLLAEDSGGMTGEGKDRQHIEESFLEDFQEGDSKFNKNGNNLSCCWQNYK